jgi:hypothetical protein
MIAGNRVDEGGPLVVSVLGLPASP